jgi:uncharacterized protein (DUF305 family)
MSGNPHANEGILRKPLAMPELGPQALDVRRPGEKRAEGAIAKDADVSWICAMIPHHQGAIDMARAGLKGSDNAESRRMAEETFQMQEKEIEKLTAWVE